jgi:hypothetical protein
MQHLAAPYRHLTLGAFPVLVESEPELQAFISTRFLHANRDPLRFKNAPGGNVARWGGASDSEFPN